MDSHADLLKNAMPFQMVPQDLLEAIAEICTQQEFAAGEEIYNFGDAADDVIIVSSGSVKHVLSDEAHANHHEKTMRSGDIFGWAAVLEGQRKRLASTTSLEPTRVIRIPGKELTNIFKTNPAVGDVVMSRFATMINKEFSVPRSIAEQVPSFKQAAGATDPGEVGGEGLLVVPGEGRVARTGLDVVDDLTLKPEVRPELFDLAEIFGYLVPAK